MTTETQETGAQVVSFAEQVEDEFLRLYERYGVGEETDKKRKMDMIDAIWGEIYEIVFKPDIDDIRYNNQISKLMTYNVADVEAVTKCIIKLSRIYGGEIKFINFTDLTGISRNTIWYWHTKNKSNSDIFSLSDSEVLEENSIIYIYSPNNEVVKYNGNGRHSGTDKKLSSLRYDVYKKMQAAMDASNTNGMSTTPVGEIAKANNNEDTGKQWENGRMEREASVLIAGTRENLLKIVQNSLYGDNPRITDGT